MVAWVWGGWNSLTSPKSSGAEPSPLYPYALWRQWFGFDSLAKLLYRIKWDIRLIASVFPNCKLIWSFVLPRISWRTSQNARSLEQARNRVNRFAAREIFDCGEKLLGTPNSLVNPRTFTMLIGFTCLSWETTYFWTIFRGPLNILSRMMGTGIFPHPKL